MKDVMEKRFVVDGEKLCKELGIKSSFNNWLLKKTKGNEGVLIRYGFVDRVDYIVESHLPNARFSQEEIKEMSPQKRSAYGIKNKITMTIECAMAIIEKNMNNQNKQKSLILLRILNCKKNNNIKLVVIEKEKKEIEFLNTLENVLEPFNLKCTRQYYIDGRRIDLYIEDLNVAIEYDEIGHKYYSYENESGRQKMIEKKLGCKFIRVSENNSDLYNVGLIMKELFQNKYI